MKKLLFTIMGILMSIHSFAQTTVEKWKEMVDMYQKVEYNTLALETGPLREYDSFRKGLLTKQYTLSKEALNVFFLTQEKLKKYAEEQNQRMKINETSGYGAYILAYLPPDATLIDEYSIKLSSGGVLTGKEIFDCASNALGFDFFYSTGELSRSTVWTIKNSLQIIGKGLQKLDSPILAFIATGMFKDCVVEKGKN